MAAVGPLSTHSRHSRLRSAFDPLRTLASCPTMVSMAQQFARSRMDRTSGMVMLAATAIALLAGFTIGPPSTDAIIVGALLLLALIILFFGVLALRVWRVGKVANDKADLIAPRFEPPIRLFLTVWLGLAGASMILFIAGLVSLPTGIATKAVITAFFYLAAVAVLNRCIGGTLVNLAILRTAAQKDDTATR